MVFESAQNNYEGQKGWNDLTPDALMGLAAPKSRGKIRPKRVATPLAGLETPPSIPRDHPSTPPLASSGSGSASPRTGPPPAFGGPPPTNASGPPKAASSLAATGIAQPPPTATSSSAKTPASPGELSQNIESLFSQLVRNPSKLGDTDKQACIKKFEQTIPHLSETHLEFLHDVLHVALQNKLEAKQSLVNYGLHNSNVSSWTVPLRRLVEQQV